MNDNFEMIFLLSLSLSLRIFSKLGRRLCVGEELAKTTLLLTTATILHRFTLCRSEDGSQLDTTPVSTFTSSPKPFQFRAITRD